MSVRGSLAEPYRKILAIGEGHLFECRECRDRPQRHALDAASMTNASSPTNLGSGPRAVTRLYVVIAVLLYLAIPVWMAWYIYDFTADGIASSVGEGIGTLLIPGLIAFAITRRRSSVIPYYIAFVVSAIVLLSANSDRIFEAYDVHQYRAEMSNATPVNFRQIIAQSKSHIGQMLNSVLELTDHHGERIQAIIASLEDDRLQEALTADTLANRDKRKFLKVLAQQKQEASYHASEDVAVEYGRMRDDMLRVVNNAPPGMQKSVLAGFDRTRPVSEQLVRDYALTYTDFYKHLIALYNILDENEGKFTVRQDSFVIFVENPAIAAYNKEMQDLRQDAGNLKKISDKWVENQRAGVWRIINSAK